MCVTSQEGVSPASEEVCVSAVVCIFDVCAHPPKVFAVGVFGDAVSRVDLAHQGTEASSFGDVLPAAHASHLHDDTYI